MPNWRILLFFSFQFPRVPSFPFSWCVLPFFFPPQNCNLVDPKFRLPSLPLLCPLYLLFAVREQCQEISSLVAWFCSMWRVLFSISDDEKLVLVRVFLSLIVWMLSCPFSNACFFFLFFFPHLLLQWFAYCSSREMYFCWNVFLFTVFTTSLPRTPLCLGVAEEAVSIGDANVIQVVFPLWIIVQLLCFLWHCAKPEKMKSLYMFF